jgi:hypothetical protein
LDKFGCVVDRMHTEHGVNFVNSERIKTQIRVDVATQSQKDGVEGNGDSLEDGAEAFVLILRGAQRGLTSSALTLLDPLHY